MKFSCDKYVLQQAAASAARAAAPKSPIAALEGLLLEAGADLRITGYDLKKAIYTNMEADIPEPGSVLVGARLFCEMLRRMPDGVVTVEAENGTVTVRCGRSSFNLVGMSAEDYPDLPSVEAENGVSLPQDLLKKMINECSFAVSTNESRPVYMGTLFEIAHNELTMVSVDGYRLALRREPVEGYGDDCSFIVPGTALSDLERLCGDSDERVKMSVGSTVILSRRLEGDFLNYKKAIPESFRITVKTARTDLLDVVERVSLIVSEKLKNPVRFHFDGNYVQLSCVTAIGKSYDECPIDGCIEDLEIGFNNHYLSDALKAAPADELNVCLNTGSSPCIFVPADGSDNFVYMVLPVRLRAGQ
jgi:DNA polymerase-3 subunit beta